MSKPFTIGIDLGGTGIKLGLVDARGNLSRTLRLSTPSKSNPQEVIKLIIQETKTLIDSVGRSKIRAIGVGMAGDIDPVKGVVRISPNLNWHNVGIKAALDRRLGFPIYAENDANAAAWAAYVVEAKRRVRNLLCVTLGTGIGGGLVLNGELYRGTTGSAGEIGHITLYPDGVQCNCGNHGCLERYVGALAMANEARRAIEAGERSLVRHLVRNDLSNITPLVLQEAALQNDRFALTLWEQMGERLGIGLSALINILNPEWIVLAGGLSRAGELLLGPVRRVIANRSFRTSGEAAKLKISRLDQDLGIVGAGLIAHS